VRSLRGLGKTVGTPGMNARGACITSLLALTPMMRVVAITMVTVRAASRERRSPVFMVPSGGATLEPSSQLVNKEVDKYPTLECRLRSSALRETRRVDTFGADPAADVQRVLGEELRAADTKASWPVPTSMLADRRGPSVS